MSAVSRSLATACAEVAARLPEALAAGAQQNPQALTRIEVPIEACSPLAWLAAQTHTTQYYWSDREGDEEMAGAGEADVLVPFGPVDLKALFRRMRSNLPQEFPRLRYYGGFRFQTDGKPGPRWKAFLAYRFVAPRFEVLRRGSKTVFACNVRPGAPENHANLAEKIRGAMAALCLEPANLDRPLPPIGAREDAPDRKAWAKLIDKAVDAFAANTLEKVVLARETTFKTETPLDPVLLLAHLQRFTTQSFEFCFHPASDRAFIGASPERLYHRLNCFIESEAIAGTRRRGKSDEEDKHLADQLQESEKDRREHQLVVQNLRENLGRFCRAVNVEESPSILRLRNVQHLYTKMEGILDDNLVDGDLIETLHPTPAVGGTPSAAALAWIKEQEPFDRGIYAAPVGWVAYDEAEFAVAIRSALVQQDAISIYSGAGIVAGSTEEDEWEEIEAKMKNFLHALGR